MLTRVLTNINAEKYRQIATKLNLLNTKQENTHI